MGKKSKKIKKSGGNDYALKPKEGKKKNRINEKKTKVPDGNDYSLFSDADELFKKQIETKIIDGKKYFNVKQKDRE